MSDDAYMPTTAEIRSIVENHRYEFLEGPDEEAFDRWLAAHDAEVKAVAFEEGAEIVQALRPEMSRFVNIGPYRQGKDDSLQFAIQGLRARAVEVRGIDERNN